MSSESNSPLGPVGADLLADRLAFAARHARWYRDRKRRNQTASFVLRFIAIPTLLFGGLCPVLSSVIGSELYSVGYLAIGSGAALLLVDTLFGVSSNWQRFMSTALRIEALTEVFRLDWDALALNGATDLDLTRAHFQLARQFTNEVNELVIRETETWEVEKNTQRDMAAALASKTAEP